MWVSRAGAAIGLHEGWQLAPENHHGGSTALLRYGDKRSKRITRKDRLARLAGCKAFTFKGLDGSSDAKDVELSRRAAEWRLVTPQLPLG